MTQSDPSRQLPSGTPPDLPAGAGTEPPAGGGTEQKPADFGELLHVLAQRSGELVAFIAGIMGQQRLGREIEARFRIRMAVLAGLFVLIVVGLATWLTYAGKLDGGSLSFLLGLVTGYMLNYLRDSMPPRAG